MFPTNAGQINKETLQHILRQFYDDTSITVSEVGGLELLTSTNDNLNSDIKKLTIHYESSKGKATSHMVVKKPLESRMVNFFHKLAQPFCHETIWYQYMSKEMPDMSPPCFYGYSPHQTNLKPNIMERLFGTTFGRMFSKSDKGIILLENVSERSEANNYQMIDKTKVLDTNAAKTAIKTLAHFHGGWLKFLNAAEMMEVTNKSTGDNISKEDLYNYLTVQVGAKMLSGIVKKSIAAMKRLIHNRLPANEATEICKKLDKYVETQSLQDTQKYIMVQEESKLNTVVHGDFWVNNMLFHGQDNEKVMFLDFQNFMAGHPARDFWYFLFISTDKEWRNKHLEACLKLYHETYSEYLEESIPFDTFKDEFQARRFICGVCVGTGMVMWNVLSPHKLDFTGINAFKAMQRKVHHEMSDPDTDDDHPMVLEMRRRMLDAIVESNDLGLI